MFAYVRICSDNLEKIFGIDLKVRNRVGGRGERRVGARGLQVGGPVRKLRKFHQGLRGEGRGVDKKHAGCGDRRSDRIGPNRRSAGDARFGYCQIPLILEASTLAHT